MPRVKIVAASLSRLFQPFGDQLSQVFHRQRAVNQRRLVKAAQLKTLAQLTAQAQPESMEGHAADKVRRELAGALLGADDLEDRFRLRLIRPHHQERQRLL